jgi:rhodanese-related sulfurtransferase
MKTPLTSLYTPIAAALIATSALLSFPALALSPKAGPVNNTAAATTTSQAEPFQLMHAKELATLLSATGSKVYVFDANDDEMRAKEGVIPGAKTLPSSSHYDTAQLLPADKNSKLVFYCANEECMASHGAAKRAAKAGYKNVYVMADGILGWKKAGNKTQAAATN